MKFKFNPKTAIGAVTASALTLVTTGAIAQEASAASSIDFSPITSAFSSGDVIAAVLSVAGVLALIYIAISGAKIVLRLIRGG